MERIFSSIFIFLLIASSTISAAGGLLENAYKAIPAGTFQTGGAWLDYPAYSDRNGWSDLIGKHASSFIEKGEQCLSHEWMAIPATAYLSFERTGDRKEMEGLLAEHNRTLLNLVMAELSEGKGRFIDQIINGVWFTCQWPSWVGVAHTNRQSSHRSLPDRREVLIDLSSMKMGSTLALIYHFFHSEFDKVDPSISASVEAAIKRNILDCFLDKDRMKANWWIALEEDRNPDTIINNWTPWCNAHVILTFLLMEKDEGRLLAAIEQSVKSVDKYLDYNTKDGACDEGPSYWAHSAGELFNYLKIMNDASKGAFDVFGDDLILKKGLFMSRSYIGDGWTVNFSDGSARKSGSKELTFRYGKAVRSQEMMDFSIYQFINRDKGKFLSTYVSSDHLFSVLEVLKSEPDINSAKKEALENASGDIVSLARDLRAHIPPATWYEDAQQLFYRNKSNWFLGAKGGHNNESHNHNDVGSFVLFVKNIPILIDPGVGIYNASTFGSKRYENWPMQSLWHNTIEICGRQQASGRQYSAEDVRFEEKDGYLTMDISNAYPEECGCKKWLRTWELTRNGLDLKEHAVLDNTSGKSFEHFITNGSVYLPGDTINGLSVPADAFVIEGRSSDGKRTVRVISGIPEGCSISLEEKMLEGDCANLSKIWGRRLVRIDVELPFNDSKEKTFNFSFREF